MEEIEEYFKQRFGDVLDIQTYFQMEKQVQDIIFKRTGVKTTVRVTESIRYGKVWCEIEKIDEIKKSHPEFFL